MDEIKLSPTEQTIVDLLAQGKARKQIVRAVSMSPNMLAQHAAARLDIALIVRTVSRRRKRSQSDSNSDAKRELRNEHTACRAALAQFMQSHGSTAE